MTAIITHHLFWAFVALSLCAAVTIGAVIEYLRQRKILHAIEKTAYRGK